MNGSSPRVFLHANWLHLIFNMFALYFSVAP
nr:rhomboid family intramembrane serine protease [Paraflavitalea speifideiaquila]